MNETNTQHPTNEEQVQFSIKAFKGIEVGIGQKDPGAAIAPMPVAQDHINDAIKLVSVGRQADAGGELKFIGVRHRCLNDVGSTHSHWLQTDGRALTDFKEGYDYQIDEGKAWTVQQKSQRKEIQFQAVFVMDISLLDQGISYPTRPPLPAQQCQDQNVEDLRDMLKQRSEVGLKKYGVTTCQSGLGLSAWLQHALEETLDHAVYLRAALRETTAPAQQGLSDARILEIAQSDDLESGQATPYCYSEAAVIAFARAIESALQSAPQSVSEKSIEIVARMLLEKQFEKTPWAGKICLIRPEGLGEYRDFAEKIIRAISQSVSGSSEGGKEG